MLRPGMVRMRGSMATRLRPCMTLNTLPHMPAINVSRSLPTSARKGLIPRRPHGPGPGQVSAGVVVLGPRSARRAQPGTPVAISPAVRESMPCVILYLVPHHCHVFAPRQCPAEQQEAENLLYCTVGKLLLTGNPARAWLYYNI